MTRALRLNNIDHNRSVVLLQLSICWPSNDHSTQHPHQQISANQPNVTSSTLDAKYSALQYKDLVLSVSNRASVMSRCGSGDADRTDGRLMVP
jgi:hypothetical protein